ncbi:hypothetical protein GH714_019594 [Hevea brasiliensis]|uniref:Uncharacterized protein n=1 Tax=Hevea brasiliensis TaxID=3981 RepID=A0A6A6M8G1_HEVBR|nr:hypothetical protein GH714_019594 [Hevea brasiliensis]
MELEKIFWGIAESKGDTKGFNVKEETNLPDDATSPHGDGEEEEADIVGYGEEEEIDIVGDGEEEEVDIIGDIIEME